MNVRTQNRYSALALSDVYYSPKYNIEKENRDYSTKDPLWLLILQNSKAIEFYKTTEEKT